MSSEPQRIALSEIQKLRRRAQLLVNAAQNIPAYSENGCKYCGRGYKSKEHRAKCWLGILETRAESVSRLLGEYVSR